MAAEPRADTRDDGLTPESYLERLSLFREKLQWVRDYL
jgi:hypothetical protein